MASAIVIDSFRDARQRTCGLLLVRPRVGYWLKLGLIAMLGASMGSGGSFNFWVPRNAPSEDGGGPGSGFGPQAAQAMRDAMQWLSENLGGLIAVIVGLVVIWLLLTVAIIYVRAVFRFIFVDAVAAPHEPSIRASWSGHTGVGLSLLLWYLFLGLTGLGLILLVMVSLIASGAMVASGEALPTVLGIGGLLGLFAAIFVIVMVMVLLQSLTDDFLVPAMYVRRCGAWEGWRWVRRAWRGQFWNVVLFYLLKLVASVGAAIAALFVVVASMLLLVLPVICVAVIVMLIAGAVSELGNAAYYLIGPGIVALMAGGLVYSYLLQVLMLPITAFFQAYSLSFVGKLDPALRTI